MRHATSATVRQEKGPSGARRYLGQHRTRHPSAGTAVQTSSTCVSGLPKTKPRQMDVRTGRERGLQRTARGLNVTTRDACRSRPAANPCPRGAVEQQVALVIQAPCVIACGRSFYLGRRFSTIRDAPDREENAGADTHAALASITSQILAAIFHRPKRSSSLNACGRGHV